MNGGPRPSCRQLASVCSVNCHLSANCLGVNHVFGDVIAYAIISMFRRVEGSSKSSLLNRRRLEVDSGLISVSFLVPSLILLRRYCLLRWFLGLDSYSPKCLIRLLLRLGSNYLFRLFFDHLRSLFHHFDVASSYLHLLAHHFRE